MNIDYKTELSQILDEELKYGLEIPFDSVSKLSKKIYEQLKLQQYMSEMDVIHVLNRIITDSVAEIVKSGEGKKAIKKLRDLFDEESKIKLLNKNIRDYFRTIPKNYTVVFNFKNITYSEEIEIKLTDKVTLKFETQYTSMLASLLKKNKSEVYQLSVYIQYNGHLTANNFDEPHSVIKQLVYLAMTLNIFGANLYSNQYSRPSGTNNGLFAPLPIQNYFVENKDKNKKYYLSLAGNELEYFDRIEWNSTIDPSDITGKIDELKKAFAILNNTQNKFKNKIKSALEWGLESDITQNETFKFILKSIALEAILGDESGEEITKTLANRCAYLLGRNHAERDKLLSEFPLLYGVRSKLVHGSKSNLGHKDKNKLFSLEAILQCVLYKEIKMLMD